MLEHQCSKNEANIEPAGNASQPQLSVPIISNSSSFRHAITSLTWAMNSGGTGAWEHCRRNASAAENGNNQNDPGEMLSEVFAWSCTGPREALLMRSWWHPPQEVLLPVFMAGDFWQLRRLARSLHCGVLKLCVCGIFIVNSRMNGFLWRSC